MTDIERDIQQGKLRTKLGQRYEIIEKIDPCHLENPQVNLGDTMLQLKGFHEVLQGYLWGELESGEVKECVYNSVQVLGVLIENVKKCTEDCEIYGMAMERDITALCCSILEEQEVLL